jgi:NAD-dependent dihydropyrimidine dehydrogenase PreA subunit
MKPAEPSGDPVPCSQAPGAVVPVIDRNRCEGKAACVAVCPTRVFVVGVLPQAERVGLSLRGRLKGFAHGWKQALIADPDACEACGRCVTACPEKAITLTRRDAGAR